MAYETIIVETKGRVGIVRLNRPNALNALNAQLIDEMSKAFDAFEDDEGIEGFRHLLDELRVQGVERVGAVEPDDADAALGFDDDGFVSHVRLLH